MNSWNDYFSYYIHGCFTRFISDTTRSPRFTFLWDEYHSVCHQRFQSIKQTRSRWIWRSENWFRFVLFCSLLFLSRWPSAICSRESCEMGKKLLGNVFLAAPDRGKEDFMNEIVLISKIQHRNLYWILGYCIEGEEKLLIYEFMENKSLDTFLFGWSLLASFLDYH